MNVFFLYLQLPHEAAVESQTKEQIAELSEHMLKTTNIKVWMADSLSFQSFRYFDFFYVSMYYT